MASGKQSKPTKGTPKKKQPQTRLSPGEVPSRSGLLDDYARRDIAGIIFIVLAIVLMLIVVLPTGDAVVTTSASDLVHHTFGVGSYILPFVLAVIGITFLFRSKKQRLSLRAAIGLAIIYISLLGFISLFAPIQSLGVDNPNLLFTDRLLIAYGGYVGAAIAWIGISLLGKVITGVILVGCMIIGIVIIGFSISKLIESIRYKAHMFAEYRSISAPLNSGSVPFAKIRRSNSASQDPLPAVFGATQNINSPSSNLEDSNTRVIDQPVVRRKLGGTSSVNAAANTSNPRNRKKRAAEDYDGGTPQMTRKLGASNSLKSEPNKVKAKTKAVNIQTLPIPDEGFELPPLSLLAKNTGNTREVSESELEETADLLQEALQDFGVAAKVVGWVAGPTVTLFKLDLPPGVRVNRVTVLNTDISLALAAPAVRIFAPIPGTNYVGIEVPNKQRQTVLLGDVLQDAPVGPLQIAIGKDVEGNSVVTDLSKMPHLLIGGTTGSGKSVSINAMIMSMLMRATPAEVRFIMIDPKRVEFTPYNGIPHLYAPVVTEPKEAASALAWGVAEMERRLKVLSSIGARNIGQYNSKIASGELDEVDENTGESVRPDQLPYIVIIIDELADLMMAVGKEVEYSICRIAQLARAAGIHLIVATQRPSTNVVTGLIKSNITNRIAFNVASGIDSRVILDSTGAEDLVGLGDLLFSKPEFAKPQRIQGCYVSEEEIAAVVAKVKEQGEPDYHSEVLKTNIITIGSTSPSGGDSSSSDDPLLWEAADIVVSSGMGSTSNIQRRLKVGYSRAGRIMDQLEEKGVVGSANGSKPREVLIDALELETLRAFEQNDDM